tara:strand:- start:1676 stop:2170 length:495 start_codon:yes stop_codon:yes gene_type:complete
MSVKKNTKNKIIPISEIPGRVSEWRREGRSIVFTNGCFDLLHAGHVWFLQEASNFGDILIIGLNSDDSVRKIKGENRPILSQEDRSFLLSSLEVTDYVIIFDEETPLNLIKEICPNVLVKGGDYIKEDIVGYDFILKNGGRVDVIKLVEGKSTTGILKKILEKQ